MSPAESGPKPRDIANLPALLAHAYAIEEDAHERYTVLADQMEVHNNPELAAMFRKLADIERLHAEKIRERASGMELPHMAPWDFNWLDAESPESSDLMEAHYLMTPHQALALALEGEQRAFRFFEQLAKRTSDNDIRKLAEEFAGEEREHIRIVEDLMTRYPEADEDWDDDFDPPNMQE